MALAWASYLAVGYLLFCGALRVCPFIIRLNLYPLLGWAFLAVFAYYLRILPFPFAVSGPWSLGILLLTLLVWNRGFRFPSLRSPLPLVLGLLVALFVLNLIPLYLRLAIPDMRDVGTWGYDQRNYVYTAAGLLDEGLLPAARRPADPWGFFTPYWEYFKESLRQISAFKPENLDWYYNRLQGRFETLRSASRDFALFPRRAFSSLDALMTSVLRIDPQQGYTLSVWIHHLWLLHVAIIFSRLLRLKTLGLIIAILLVAYWPNSHLAIAADNRDQANCLVLVFVLFILAQLRDCRFWPTVTCISALLVGYPELAMPALVVFYAQRYDAAGRLSIWLRQIGKEVGTALLCLLPVLPPALLGLVYQWGVKSGNRTLVFPVQYGTPLSGFDYLPGWKLLWNDDFPAIHYLALLLDIMILLMAAYGLILIFRKRQFGTLIGYGAVLACGYLFLARREYYPAYKILTILWPFFIWLLLLALSRFLRPHPQSGFRLSRYRYAPAALLIIASLPAVPSLAQIPFPGAYGLVGANHLLADPVPGDVKSFLQSRVSDLNRLKQIARKVAKKNQSVLVIGNPPEAIPDDVGFAHLLLRKNSVFFPQSLREAVRAWWMPPYPSVRPASSHQPIDHILLVNTTETFDFHRPERHIFAGALDGNSFRRMNFSTHLPLKEREHLLIICRSVLNPASTRSAPEKQCFLFENGELRLDIFHINAPIGEVGRLSFATSSTGPVAVEGELEVSLNDKVVEPSAGSEPASKWSQTLYLNPDAMHQELVIKVKQKEPSATPSPWCFELTGFESSLPEETAEITKD